MTIRTSGLPLLGDGDFIRTDRSVRWGIKCSAINGLEFVQAFVQQADGSWNAEAMLDDGFDTRAKEYPNVIDWMTKHMLPRLNDWLAARFPATSAPPTAQSRIEQADALINTRLAITVRPDGTLIARIE